MNKEGSLSLPVGFWSFFGVCEENTKEFDFPRLFTQFLKLRSKKEKKHLGIYELSLWFQSLYGAAYKCFGGHFWVLVTYLNFAYFVWKISFL